MPVDNLMRDTETLHQAAELWGVVRNERFLLPYLPSVSFPM